MIKSHRFRHTVIGWVLLLSPLPALAAGGGAAPYLKKPDAWFSSPEARRIATDILSYQFYPPGKQYHRYITFNDGAMERLLIFLREVHRADTYAFVPGAERELAGEAFDRGIACILKCQIQVDGKLTVWCAQHDEIDCSPRPARAFELASFSGAESVGIARLLMSLDHPGPEVRAAIEGAVAWFEAAKLTGLRLDRRRDPKGPKGVNLVVVPDSNSPPQWARFYDLKTGKPMFCDRDGVPKSSIAEIGYERRNAYSWYGTWPQALLETAYPAWKARNAR